MPNSPRTPSEEGTLRLKPTIPAASASPATVVEVPAAEPRTDAERTLEEPRERFHIGLANDKARVYQKDPNFFYYWFNDDEGRLDEAYASGYRYVLRNEIALQDGADGGNTDMGDRVSRSAGTNKQGGARRMYLMKCPLHIKQEIDAIYHKMNNSKLDSILSGDVQSSSGSSRDSKFYVPRGGSSYTTSNKFD